MTKKPFSLLILALLPTFSFAQSATNELTYTPEQIAQIEQLRQQALSASEQVLPPNQVNQGLEEFSQPIQAISPNSLPENSPKPPSEQELMNAKREMWLSDSSQNLRQSGGKFTLPTKIGVAYSTDPGDIEYLARWKYRLVNNGIEASKIDFEASRLSRSEFSLWASRLIWWEQFMHPNVVEIKKD